MEKLLNFNVYLSKNYKIKKIIFRKKPEILSSLHHIKKGAKSKIDIFEMSNGFTAKSIERTSGMVYTTAKDGLGNIVSLSRITSDGSEQRFMKDLNNSANSKKWLDVRMQYH